MHPIRLLTIALCLGLSPLRAAEPWETALDQMPLGPGGSQLNPTNWIPVCLAAFQSNSVVKALVFLPGATDELYLVRRATARLTNASPSLLDAVHALTRQTPIRATFSPPMLLLHTGHDLLEATVLVQHEPTATKVQKLRFVPHCLYVDRDWDFLEPILKKQLKADIRPGRRSSDSWHFYRHNFAAWGLNGREALEATALAGKTKFTIRRNRVTFELDQPQPPN